VTARARSGAGLAGGSTMPPPRRSMALRIVPASLLAARRPQRMVERSVMFYRRSWILLVSGFFEPLLYLLSVQVGFAALVGEITDGGVTYDYAQFVAPALLASAAMNGAVFDSTANVFEKLRHSKLYDTVLATPMTAADVAIGEIAGAMLRGMVYSVAFIATMWALGLVASPLIVLAVPACVLIGFAFASMGMAYTTYMRSWSDMEYVNAVTLPLLLFSATFYPLSSYGQWQWLVQLSPLYHGVAIVRGCNLGELEWSMLGNAAVLAALAIVGLRLTARRIDGLLLS
jgi:lipooligosaccharide transport system permease protein